MRVLGLDIGGANLKAADTEGNWAQRPFAIWRAHETLSQELQTLVASFSAIEGIAVTMTAELADCYRTKADGVRHIVAAVQAICGSTPVFVWSLEGKLIPASDVEQHIANLAASNWHALATWLAQQFDQENALLIDIGTTTTDIIPFGMGRVLARGHSDFGRLVAGELVYTGIRRTPVCAVVNAVHLGSVRCPIASELFSTMHDVYLLLNDVPEAPDDCDTANGRPATRAEAYDRLVRQLCCDRTEISLPEAIQIAREIAQRQTEQIAFALDQVLNETLARSECRRIVVSGSGRFLARRMIEKSGRLRNVSVTEIAEQLNPGVPDVACAYAVAQLAQAGQSSHKSR